MILIGTQHCESRKCLLSRFTGNFKNVNRMEEILKVVKKAVKNVNKYEILCTLIDENCGTKWDMIS